MYAQIYDPYSKKAIPVNSTAGHKLLKNMVLSVFKHFQAGGGLQENYQNCLNNNENTSICDAKYGQLFAQNNSSSASYPPMEMTYGNNNMYANVQQNQGQRNLFGSSSQRGLFESSGQGGIFGSSSQGQGGIFESSGQGSILSNISQSSMYTSRDSEGLVNGNIVGILKFLNQKILNVRAYLDELERTRNEVAKELKRNLKNVLAFEEEEQKMEVGKLKAERDKELNELRKSIEDKTIQLNRLRSMSPGYGLYPRYGNIAYTPMYSFQSGLSQNSRSVERESDSRELKRPRY